MDWLSTCDKGPSCVRDWRFVSVQDLRGFYVDDKY